MRRGALVLCGGRSRRMGRDKAWLPFGGERLLQRVVARVAACCDEVVVVARPGQELPPLPADVRVAHDELPDQGPLGGLVPGLRALAACDACFATSCDAPFVSAAVIDLLFARVTDHDVAVAESGGFTHPLSAVYRPHVVPALERLLAAGRLRPVFLYDEVATARVDEHALRAVDPELDALRNVNTPEAYEDALARAFPELSVELYDIARARAGRAVVPVRADTLRGALLQLARLCPALAPDVVTADGALAAHWRASVGGASFVDAPDTPLAGDAPLIVISALAGG